MYTVLWLIRYWVVQRLSYLWQHTVVPHTISDIHCLVTDMLLGCTVLELSLTTHSSATHNLICTLSCDWYAIGLYSTWAISDNTQYCHTLSHMYTVLWLIRYWVVQHLSYLWQHTVVPHTISHVHCLTLFELCFAWTNIQKIWQLESRKAHNPSTSTYPLWLWMLHSLIR